MRLPSLSARQRLVGVISVSTILVGLLVVVGMGVMILQERRMDGWARTYAHLLPLPAASIEGEWVLYRELLPRWEKIDQFYARQAELPLPEGQTPPTAADRVALQQEVYEQLLRERLLRVRAEQDAFSLSSEVVNAQMDALLARSEESASSTEPVVLTPEQLAQKRQEFTAELDRLTGWTYQEYLDWVLHPALLEEGLARRAEIAGQSLDLWKTSFDEALANPKVVRKYLDFSQE